MNRKQRTMFKAYVINKTTEEIVYEGVVVSSDREGYSDDMLSVRVFLRAGITEEELNNHAVGFDKMVTWNND